MSNDGIKYISSMLLAALIALGIIVVSFTLIYIISEVIIKHFDFHRTRYVFFQLRRHAQSVRLRISYHLARRKLCENLEYQANLFTRADQRYSGFWREIDHDESTHQRIINSVDNYFDWDKNGQEVGPEPYEMLAMLRIYFEEKPSMRRMQRALQVARYCAAAGNCSFDEPESFKVLTELYIRSRSQNEPSFE